MGNTVTPKKQHLLMYELEEDFFWFTSLRENEKYFINKYFQNKNKSEINILDAGCGTGYFVYELKQEGYNAKGFDYSDIAVELCTKRGLKLNQDIYKMDIFDLKFEKDSFDCIILNDVLFAFNLKEANTIFKNLKQILKPGGIIIGQTAALKFLYSQNDIVAGTKHRYTTKEIESLLIENDFFIEKLSYRNFIFFLPFAIKRLIDKKKLKNINLKNAKSDLKPMNKMVNNILKTIFSIDNFLLRYLDYPIGGTVFWIGKKEKWK